MFTGKSTRVRVVGVVLLPALGGSSCNFLPVRVFHFSYTVFLFIYSPPPLSLTIDKLYIECCSDGGWAV